MVWPPLVHGDAAAEIDLLRLRVLRPETYGAVGDGVADDTVALTSALAALTPGATPSR